MSGIEYIKDTSELVDGEEYHIHCVQTNTKYCGNFGGVQRGYFRLDGCPKDSLRFHVGGDVGDMDIRVDKVFCDNSRFTIYKKLKEKLLGHYESPVTKKQTAKRIPDEVSIRLTCDDLIEALALLGYEVDNYEIRSIKECAARGTTWIELNKKWMPSTSSEEIK